LEAAAAGAADAGAAGVAAAVASVLETRENNAIIGTDNFIEKLHARASGWKSPSILDNFCRRRCASPQISREPPF
jgi:hypothetical protein